jgi:hypothetical protein
MCHEIICSKFQIFEMRIFLVFIVIFGRFQVIRTDNGVKDYNYLLFENFVLNEKIFQVSVVSQITAVIYKLLL